MNNIIHAVFRNGSRYAVTRSVTRQDYGVRLMFDNVELPENYQVHFSNTKGNSGTAKTSLGTREDGAAIPDEYLITGKTVYAWVFVQDETSGMSLYMTETSVQAKPNVVDDPPTPAQESAWDAAVERLNTATDAAEEAQRKAEDAQEAAETAQNNADSFATDSEAWAVGTRGGVNVSDGDVTFQNNAKYWARMANQSSQTAGDLAHQASVSELLSKNYAEDAEAWAVGTREGEAVEDGDESYHNNSKYYAEQSASKAADARLFAGDASGYADTASKKADEAADSAAAAEQTKTELENSIYTPTTLPASQIESFSAPGEFPVNDMLVNIAPVQAGSGDPSPENIRAISGWNGCAIFQSKYNLLDQSVVTSASDWALSTDEGFKSYDGVPVYKGSLSSLRNRFETFQNRIKTPAVPGRRYRFRVWWRSVNANSDNGLKLRVWYSDGTNTDSSPMSANQTWTRISIATDANKTPVGVGFIYNHNMQIYMAGLMCMDYDQYQAIGDSSFVCPDDMTGTPTVWQTQAGTVYAGTFDPITGDLKARPYYASYNGETLVGPWISDRDVYADGTTPTTGAQVVDLGGAETTYRLRPAVVRTLSGQNNFWADCGDVSVTYGAYMEAMQDETDRTVSGILESIAPLEKGYTASRNYSAGDFLFVGTQFYQATANIAIGGTIVPGTNVAQTTVAENLGAGQQGAADFHIAWQPSDSACAEGTDATFHVSVSGGASPYSYRWFVLTTTQGAAWKETTTQGYDTDTITVGAAASRNGYQYYCEITDGEGRYLRSRTVTLTVI